MRWAELLNEPEMVARVDGEWDRLTGDFAAAYDSMPTKFMQRGELSFHKFVKLLGYLCLGLKGLEGDIVEIGVWKGKSLALMSRLADVGTRVIGIDPCELVGQLDELGYFHRNLFPNAEVVVGYSQNVVGRVVDLTTKIKLLHIDGNHASENVWMDFLMYEHFVAPGGCIVFDDYMDHVYSPDVRPTVDKMRRLGLFDRYDVVGAVPRFENSYLLIKTS